VPGRLHPTTALVALAAVVACRSVSYAAWERVGYEKRDLLRGDVAAVKEQQAETSEQFQDALERLRAVYGSSGSELERRYDELKGETQAAEREAERLRERIREVETVADDLFEEWESEIDTLQRADFRRRSSEQLRASRARFATLETAMRRAEGSMDPVLAQLRDQVIFLKHNLNAQSLGTLEGEVAGIDRDVAQLVAALQRSSEQADAFIATLGGE
jgi:chromosome segregation ATPase